MSGGLHIHLQPLGGIAGDMFVAAMLDAFPDFAPQVFSDVAAVLPRDVGEARLVKLTSHGIAARHFSLRESEAFVTSENDELETASADAHTDGRSRYRRKVPAAPTYSSEAQTGRRPGPQPGTYRVLRRVIEDAALIGSTTQHALGILRVLAEAEAEIHDVATDDVHFHELAAWDSLMDVVAAGSVIASVGATAWSVDALPLGGGLVSTQHGPLPVPPPATTRILKGYPWRSDSILGERVTPTGAAIVRYLVGNEPFVGPPTGTLLGSGYGAGTRTLPGMANVLRVLAFETGTPEVNPSVAVVQFDIDDMTGEEIGIAADRLRSLPGVFDVVLIPAQGKKGRPVTLFQLLVAPDALQRCGDIILSETATIGLRWSLCERRILPREVFNLGDGVRVKEVRRPDGRQTRKAESDDLGNAGNLTARRAKKSRSEERK